MLKHVAATVIVAIGLTGVAQPASALRPEGQYYRPRPANICSWEPCAWNRFPGRVSNLQHQINRMQYAWSSNAREEAERLLVLEQYMNNIGERIGKINEIMKAGNDARAFPQ